MNVVKLHMEMDDDKFEKIITVLEAIGNVQVDREIPLPKAARQYGWAQSSLREWVKLKKLIPYTQKVKGGTIFLKASDCRKLQEMNAADRKAASVKVKPTPAKKFNPKHTFI